MFCNIRNVDWSDDLTLKADLTKYVQRRYNRNEILTIVKKDYAEYAWSIRTLANRLNYFEIRYTNYDVDLQQVYAAVGIELKGTGCKLGYRAMCQKIREIHNLNIPRDVVYNVMQDVDPDGLKNRGGVGLPKRKRKEKRFISKGPDCTMSLDGHDKLCGYQKSMFPLFIYGGQDAYSGKITFLKIWMSNNNPNIVARHYYEYVKQSKTVPDKVRIDRGTETDMLTTIHCYMHKLCGTYEHVNEIVSNCVLYGPSTANKIERWWRELHHRMETFFKEQLSRLLNEGHYDQTCQEDRDMLAYIYIPVIQKELDIFRTTVWNHARGRKQVKKALPTGIPDFLYEHPEQFGGVKSGTTVTEEQLTIVAEESGIMDPAYDFYLNQEQLIKFQTYVPDTSIIESYEAVDAFIYLKQECNASIREEV